MCLACCTRGAFSSPESQVILSSLEQLLPEDGVDTARSHVERLGISTEHGGHAVFAFSVL